MKRGLLVLAALLLLAGISSADYIVIRINLTSVAPVAPYGEGGYPMEGGRTGEGGGTIGQTTGGAGGGVLVGGEGGKPAGSGTTTGTDPNQPKPDQPPSYFIAVVEVDYLRFLDPKDKKFAEIRHRWTAPGNNQTFLVEKMEDIEVRIEKSKTLYQRMQEEQKRLLDKEPRGTTELSPLSNLRLAEWMLWHWNLPVEGQKFDMKKEFEGILDKLKKADPAKLDAAAKLSLEALVGARKIIQTSLEAPTKDVNELRQILPVLQAGEEYADYKSSHYVMVYRSRDAKAAEQRVRRLEHIYAGYYYWFALHGVPIPAPEKKLICVLADELRSFRQIHQIFDYVPTVADGFYSRFDNVAVFCASRFDGPYLRLQTMASNWDRQGFDMKALVEGKPPSKEMIDKLKAGTEGAEGTDPQAKYVYLQMLALARQAALDEGEIATLTHEGIQQLATATGLLPARVHLPESVRFGLGSFFDLGKSDGQLNLVCYWSGVGAPHWVHLPWFHKALEFEGKEMSVKEGLYLTGDGKIKMPSIAMVDILTDKHFRAARKSDRDDREVLLSQARAEAWALTYYLAHAKLAGLLKFYAELRQLPRDMDLSDEIILRAFAKSFGLQDDAGNIDPTKWEDFEKEWKGRMAELNVEGIAK